MLRNILVLHTILQLISSSLACVRIGHSCEVDDDCCGSKRELPIKCVNRFRHLPGRKCERVLNLNKKKIKKRKATTPLTIPPADDSKKTSPHPNHPTKTKPNRYNNLADTPPMGWNPWNCYKNHGLGATEEIVLNAARVMKEKLLWAGYEYVNLDCGYSKRRRDQITGDLVVDTEKFPNGMKWLGDQIHEMGLKFGMYGALGYAQCCSSFRDHKANDGSGHGCSKHKECRTKTYHQQDAQLWASWGIDLLKFDGCGGHYAAVPLMGQALLETGRDIIYSIHSEVDLKSGMHRGAANFWRTSYDIGANYEEMLYRAMDNDKINKYMPGGPGGWNDPDMLQVGNFGVIRALGAPPTVDPLAESRTHFALWCIMKSPLLIGTFLHNITDTYLDILTNPLAVGVNQDPLGEQGTLKKDGGWVGDNARPTTNPSYGFQIWSGALSNNGAAAVLANLDGNVTKHLTLTNDEMPDTRKDIKIWNIIEAFTKQERKHVTLPVKYAVGKHDAAMLILTPA